MASEDNFLQYTIVFKDKIISNVLNISFRAIIALKNEVITIYRNANKDVSKSPVHEHCHVGFICEDSEGNLVRRRKL